MKKRIKRLWILLFWIVIWFLAARAVDNGILLAGPGEALKELLQQLENPQFYRSVGGSLMRIGAGFLSGFVMAVILAGAGSRFVIVEEAISPVMRLFKAVPVASFTVLLLIWWGSSFLAAAVSFLVVLPNIYISTLEGLRAANRELKEMASVFRLPYGTRFFYIYRPALKPFLYSGMKIALGLCWKSGVAAEIIGISDFSIGGQLYLSKIYLNTAGVFAWTAVVLVLSVIFEKAVLWAAGKFFDWEPCCSKPPAVLNGRQNGDIKLVQVVRRYGSQTVLDEVSGEYRAGGTFYLTSPSGSGKTTLLRLLAGLEKPDAGEIARPPFCSMVFQEDRLCIEYSAVKNLEMVTGDKKAAEEALRKLLPEDSLYKSCSRLSGGMKRRVALARAMEAQSDYVLLDEPFTGMDRDTKERAENYVEERQAGRTLIIAAHNTAAAEQSDIVMKEILIKAVKAD